MDSCENMHNLMNILCIFGGEEERCNVRAHREARVRVSEMHKNYRVLYK